MVIDAACLHSRLISYLSKRRCRIALLPKKLCDAVSFTPKPGDRINAESVDWTILECPLNTLRSTYRCMTRDLILAYQLRTSLSVRRPGAVPTTDNAGSRTYPASNYSTPYANIPCRFQEMTSRIVDERGKRLTVKTYTVTVGQRLRLTGEDQILDADGNVHEVLSWNDADRIDQLMTLECERKWGPI